MTCEKESLGKYYFKCHFIFHFNPLIRVTKTDKKRFGTRCVWGSQIPTDVQITPSPSPRKHPEKTSADAFADV